jgi:uncharacterized protein with NAD-binding domain and iron-sulfur cluster
MAGLTTAWALSRDGWQRELASITLLERSWHPGGKAGSVRGAHGRIEEHGLHVWLGYYDNAFALMRDCYAELDRATTDPACPVRNWRDAFSPTARIGVANPSGDGWEHWIASFATNDHLPGDPGATGLRPDRFVERSLQLLWDVLLSADGPTPRSTISTSPDPPRSRPQPDDLARTARRLELAALAGAARMASLLAEGAAVALGRDDRLLGGVASELGALQRDIDRRLERRSDGRRLATIVDLVITAIKGVTADGLLVDRDGFAAVDDEDFRSWLERHGARPSTVDSGIVRGMYDLVFAYEGGDPNRPRFAAGQGLELAARFFFDYKGAIFWKMTAGMGDVVIAPMYEALRRRGVRIELGTDVDEIRLSNACPSVESVSLRTTAPLGATSARVGGLPCFVRPEGAVPTGVRTLRRGEDFDVVVLAVSVGAVPLVCPALSASERWTTMMRSVGTVATRAGQVWLARSEAELGLDAAPLTTSGWGPPFDTYASMSHLIEREEWQTARRPRGLAYLCGVVDESNVDRADPDVDGQLTGYLHEGISRILPELAMASRDVDGGPVVDTFTVIPHHPSDRYVQSLPGSRRVRLGAAESGVDGMVLAGDWVRTGLDAGCIEAAVISGIQAANVVMGSGVDEGVVGGWKAPSTQETPV